MSKYQPLTVHLRESGSSAVPMTFADIEHVIGTALPPSALKHRAYWSNNPTNSVLTRAWLAAGYASADVDMANRKLMFRKVASDEPHAGTRDGRYDQYGGGGVPAAAEGHSGSFARVFGALKGTVTIAPGTDLTDPIGEDWDAAR